MRERRVDRRSMNQLHLLRIFEPLKGRGLELQHSESLIALNQLSNGICCCRVEFVEKSELVGFIILRHRRLIDLRGAAGAHASRRLRRTAVGCCCQFE